MPLVPVTYIKAGVTPANWFDLSVIDRKTGKDIRFVVEADIKAGWVRKQAVGRGGQFVVDAGGFVYETIRGDFSIVNPGVPGSPVAMVEGEAEPEPVKHILSRRMGPRKKPKAKAKPRTSPTTRVIFGVGRYGGMVIVGPGGEASLPPAHFSILATLCGKPDGQIVDWVYLSESVWPNPDDMPDAGRDVLQTQISFLRQTLKSIKSEIQIVTHWWRGYSVIRRPHPINDNEEDAQVSKVATA